MKKLLSILTSVSLLATALSSGAYAVPTAVDIADTGFDYVPEIFEESETELSSEGPSVVDIIEYSKETNEKFGTPELYEGAFLFSELEGEGTKESPYLIGTADDLMLMANNINSGINTSAYYKLTSDIDLGGNKWTPAGYVVGADPYTDYSKAFSGHFDGDGYTISNFSIVNDNPAYIGFFGFIYEGTVKNVTFDSVSINVTSSSREKLYVGTVVGRIIANSKNGRSNIINCHVTNSSIDVVSNGTIYVGGLAGTGATGDFENAHVFMAFSSVDCDINAATKSERVPYPVTNQNDCDLVVAGGLVGYYGSLTGSKISAINCHADVNVYTSALESYYSHAFSGGAFGNLRSYVDGKNDGSIYIDSCYTKGTAVAESDYMPYKSGGFIAQFLPTNDAYIYNCYSDCDASGTHLKKGIPYDPVAGGFVGMLQFDKYSASMGKKIFNCYASGDAVDLTFTEQDPKDTSFVGGFAGYSTAGVFSNCYKLFSQNIVGTDIFADDVKTLSEEDVKYFDRFVGFDFDNTWEMDTSAEYPYPTLIEKTGFADFIVDGVSFATAVFGADGKVTEPVEKPEKAPTVDKEFTFSYWSLSENGTPFNFGSDTLSESTNLYAVFTSSVRKYDVRFISGDTDFVPAQKIAYGSAIVATSEIPLKEDSETHYYEFSHWSEQENGPAVDFTNLVVSKNYTFYAVFNEYDKSAWRGEVAESFSYGHGTEISPYIIRTSDEFALFAKVINEQVVGYANAYYALGTDVNLGGHIWIPIGKSENIPFSANFDGRGYEIRNFVLSDTQYAGIFGYVVNANIKNVHVKDFKVDLSIKRAESENYSMYVGGLVGYLSAKNGYTSSISCVKVSGVQYNVDVEVANLYLGNIAGYCVAEARSTISVTDSFATNDITVTNMGGYNHIGGITGMGEMKSKSTFLITRCYNVGNISADSFRTVKAGGLVGYLKSSGSAYLPEVGGTSSDDANLSEDDVDIMLSDSFAITSIRSSTTGPYSNSNLGHLVGEVNTHASVKNISYPVAYGLTLDPSLKDSKIGTGTAHANLMNEEKLRTNYGFDFENTWVFVADSKYPVLKCMILTKPLLKISTSLTDGTLSATINARSSKSAYTVIVSVYNARNQLIKVERRSFDSTELVQFDLAYENMDKATRIALSMVEKSSLKPLLESMSVDFTKQQ